VIAQPGIPNMNFETRPVDIFLGNKEDKTHVLLLPANTPTGSLRTMFGPYLVDTAQSCMIGMPLHRLWCLSKNQKDNFCTMEMLLFL
jgi:hypothetical protein